MIANWIFALSPTLAELIGIDQASGDSGVAQQAGQVTLIYVLAALLLAAMLLVAFRKSKRTHLD